MSLKALCRGLLAVAALAASAGSALAQDVPVVATGGGLFFKEIAKDGRIYVFNSPAEAERFEKSGETAARSRRSASARTARRSSATARPRWSSTSSSTASPRRWTGRSSRCRRSSGATARRASPSATTSTWRCRTASSRGSRSRSRTTTSGWRAPRPRATARAASASVARSSSSRAGSTSPSSSSRSSSTGRTQRSPSRTASSRTRTSTGTSPSTSFRVRFGQFKAPYGRQQLTSSGAQQFVDRSIVTSATTRAARRASRCGARSGTNKLDWRAMISNGNGRSQSLNDNGKFLYSGRLQYQPLGNTRMNQWGSGAAAHRRRPGRLRGRRRAALRDRRERARATTCSFAATTANAINAKDVQYGGDYIFKYRGFASWASTPTARRSPSGATPESSATSSRTRASTCRRPTRSRRTSSAWAPYVEIAGRYAGIDPTTGSPTATARRSAARSATTTTSTT